VTAGDACVCVAGRGFTLVRAAHAERIRVRARPLGCAPRCGIRSTC
jgi:hypothetical protein